MSFNPVTPMVAVDAVILNRGNVLVIKRKFPPLGHALPGGFVDVGETLDAAVRREVSEECGIDSLPPPQYLGYLDAPTRDPRRHVISHGFLFNILGDLEYKAGDDAAEILIVPANKLPAMVMMHDTFVKRALKKTQPPYGYGW